MYSNTNYIDDCNMSGESIGLRTRWVEKTVDTANVYLNDNNLGKKKVWWTIGHTAGSPSMA